MAYATVDDYMARYGEVSNELMLQECLNDCAALMDAEMDARGVDHTNPSASFADRLMRVCRAMANRIMPSEDYGSDVPVGATQMSVTAGSYTQSFTMGMTYGTPKMLPSERSMLGIGARIGCGSMAGGGDD